MKILILSNTSWNIYNFRLNLIRAIIESGHEVIIVAPLDDYTIYLKKKGISFIPVKMDLKGQNPFQELNLLFQYYRIFKNTNPSLVLTFTIKPTIYGNFAAKILNIKVISNITGLGTIFIKKSVSTFIAVQLYRKAFQNTQKVFFQNNTDYRFFRLKGLVNKKQVSILPGSGVDLRLFNVVNRNFDVSNLKFLFVGRLIKDKGIQEYLLAAKNIKKIFPNVQFNIVGKLGYKNKTAITKQDLQFYIDNKIINYISHTDNIIEIYKKMDIMVLPSYREGMSRSLIEAAAMKMPIITSNVPGCKELVNNFLNGYLVKVKDSKDLEEKIMKMISLSQIELVKMGLESRSLIENCFSEEIIIRKYLKQIHSIKANNRL